MVGCLAHLTIRRGVSVHVLLASFRLWRYPLVERPASSMLFATAFEESTREDQQAAF